MAGTSKMHRRVLAGGFHRRQMAVITGGEHPYVRPDKPELKADKGKRLGSCNRTACQGPGAYWYNKGTRAFYCTTCAHMINSYPLPDGSLLCAIDKEASDQYYYEVNKDYDYSDCRQTANGDS